MVNAEGVADALCTCLGCLAGGCGGNYQYVICTLHARGLYRSAQRIGTACIVSLGERIGCALEYSGTRDLQDIVVQWVGTADHDFVQEFCEALDALYLDECRALEGWFLAGCPGPGAADHENRKKDDSPFALKDYAQVVTKKHLLFGHVASPGCDYSEIVS